MAKIDRTANLKQKIFESMQTGVILITGKAGTGKTTTAVCIVYNLRNLLGKSALLDFPANKPFGPYRLFTEKRLVVTMRRINKYVRAQNALGKGVSHKDLGKIKLPIKITNSALLLDESYNYFDSRTPGNKLIKLFGYFVSQHRHYFSTIVIVSPDEGQIDNRVMKQVTHVVRCRKMNDFVIARIEDVRSGVRIRLNIPGDQYWKMYNSYNALTIRSDALNIKGL